MHLFVLNKTINDIDYDTMSGIYLTVWDDEKRHRTSVLCATESGWPRITFAYTGDTVDLQMLKYLASRVLERWVTKTLTLTKAHINSFTDCHGKARHDVLLAVKETDEIELSRTALIKNAVLSGKFQFVMKEPQVTAGMFETLKDAEFYANQLNAEHMPYRVTVVGVAVN